MQHVEQNKTTPVVNVAIYCRKSVADQERKEFGSIEQQERACMGYIASREHLGWRALPQPYVDYGISGKNVTDRPAFLQMMRDCEEGKIQHICAFRFDRLSRSPRDFAEMNEKLTSLGIGFSSVSENIDASTPTGRLLLGVILGFAQCEREVSQERVKRFFDTSRAAGRYLGGVCPYGYFSKKCHLYPDPETSGNVEKIFRKYIELQGATKKVVVALAGLGITRRDGTPWNTRSVNTVIRCPRYCGMAYDADGVLIKGDQDALITRELWDQAQRLSKALQVTCTRGGKPPTLENGVLNGIARCGHCGGALSYHFSSHVSVRTHARCRYGSYVCVTDRRRAVSGLCPVRSVSSDFLEGIAQQYIEAALVGSIVLAEKVAARLGVETEVLVGHLRERGRLWAELGPLLRRELIRSLLTRMTVYGDHVEMEFALAAFGVDYEDANFGERAVRTESGNAVWQVPVQFAKVSHRRKVVCTNAPVPVLGPSTPNPLLQAFCRAREWLDLLDKGLVKSIRDLARLVDLDRNHVRRTLRLCLVSPRIVRSVLNGHEPDGLTLKKLYAIETVDWAEQERLLGFSA